MTMEFLGGDVQAIFCWHGYKKISADKKISFKKISADNFFFLSPGEHQPIIKVIRLRNHTTTIKPG